MSRQLTPIIHHFQTVRPRFLLKQSESLDWLSKSHCIANKEKTDSIETLHLKRRYSHYGCSEKRILERGTEIEDFTHQQWNKMGLFNLGEGRKTKLDSRMSFYKEHVSKSFSELFENSTKESLEYLIHVTCTGYLSPSPAQEFLTNRGLGETCNVLHLYHMGCYASLPAIKTAKALLRDTQKKITIVHNELCTLHFNPWDSSPQQLVIHSLFSDGHIKYTVESKSDKIQKTPSFEILALNESIIPESSQDMGWRCGEDGFIMSLSPLVPKKFTNYVGPFLRNWLKSENLNWDKVHKEAFFAIHPGGPKIIDNIQECLNLETWQISHSSRVLYRFGNMSSATLPHIWEKMLNSNEIPKDSLIISLAFGPGLTLHASVFKKTI